jgi:translation initiation factor IF-2
MAEEKSYRIIKVAAELNVSVNHLAEHLNKKGFKIEAKPTSKIDYEMYELLLRDFQSDKKAKQESQSLEIHVRKDKDIRIGDRNKPIIKKSQEDSEDEVILIKDTGFGRKHETESKPEPELPKVVTGKIVEKEKTELPGIKVVGKIDLEPEVKAVIAPKAEPEVVVVKVVEMVVAPPEKVEDIKEEVKTELPKVEKAEPPPITETTKVEDDEDDEAHRETKYEKLKGLSIKGKIELPSPLIRKPVASSDSKDGDAAGRKKRKRKAKPNDRPIVPAVHPLRDTNKPGFDPKKRPIRPAVAKKDEKEEISVKEIQDKIKATMAKMGGQKGVSPGNVRQKLRRQKRDDHRQTKEDEDIQKELESKILRVTEFVTANELASLMDIQVTDVITSCLSLGMMVSINQRLDAETITIVADEFGYEVQFVDAEEQVEIIEDEDRPEDLKDRSPIVTVMGHVDHGKTSLLDYVRNTNVIAGEAGGITQHVAAYEVSLKNGRTITFVDTPGHEAFTAMRARGAKVTDVAIIVIAADDNVMPQTKEAISHAQAAGVPIVFAFNKMDRETANADKIREELSAMNVLVEEWGGKYQAQEISAKTGTGVEALLDKVLLEADMLELKANPNKRGKGTIMEAEVALGRGTSVSMLVQDGTLRIGDALVAGHHFCRVRAMFNERDQQVQSAGPGTPVKVLGFTTMPAAGDVFHVIENEAEAKEIANKRAQLQREQGIRATKHITLDEIGRRLAIGNFKELNIIVKGDVDGSVEALSDSLLKLSTQQVQVNIIHKSVGQITESDVLLASASDAIIIGFQVRPAQGARKLAENEQIDIRLYSVIYHAIEEIKSAMEGMLSPEYEEKINGSAEIREIFKVTKVGTVAGCMVIDGKMFRDNKIRLIRDGVVVYTGELASLKRFKDDQKEVARGYECGMQIKNYNDLNIGDIIEGFQEVEIKKKL